MTGQNADDVIISAPSLPSLASGLRQALLSPGRLEAALAALAPESEAIFSMDIPSADGTGHG
ncbi:hypothetical protein, partial [Serratia liquefaciens]|uniref:hypothetical protein n=1 Tax=Serratia liquefaciens TaxID=614 RepID=UPI00235F0EBA